MKIPKYIRNHIEANNKLLQQADKHAQIVNAWYEKQLELLEADESSLPDEEFSEIQENWLGNGCIDCLAMEMNLELLEQEE